MGILCFDKNKGSNLNEKHSTYALKTYTNSAKLGSRGCYLSCRGLLMPIIKTQIEKGSLIIQNEHLVLLHHIALTFPNEMVDVALLCHPKDHAQDILLNLASFRQHDRLKALQRL